MSALVPPAVPTPWFRLLRQDSLRSYQSAPERQQNTPQHRSQSIAREKNHAVRSVLIFPLRLGFHPMSENVCPERNTPSSGTNIIIDIRICPNTASPLRYKTAMATWIIHAIRNVKIRYFIVPFLLKVTLFKYILLSCCLHTYRNIARQRNQVN